MSVITLSTVGFGEIHPLGQGGRVFAAILILFNLGLLGYSVSTITGIFSEGGFTKLLKDYRMHRSIQQLKDHVIVCGFGRHAHEVTYELSKQGKPFVVIENNHESIELLKEKYGINNFFIMGHSYGAISSKWLARNLGTEIQGSIHSAAQTVASPRMRAYGYSAESFDMSSLKAPALNIHHGDDQCIYTPYSTVLAYSKNNLITVKGGIPNGDVCGGGHNHSFEGREEVSSKAIIQWIKTGQVQSSIGE
jgi:hypothetical protein